MTWGKVDDKLHGHPKALAAGLEAIGLWTMALSHCAAYLTDGFVNSQFAMKVCQSKWQHNRAVSALLKSGLWVEVEGGFQFKDWCEYQPTKAQVLEERRKKSEAGKKGGQASGQARASADASAENELPSRPVPSRTKEREEYIVGSSGEAQPALALTVEPLALPEDAVWAAYLAGWRVRIAGKRAPDFTEKRRVAVRARLESYSPEDLTRAIDALWASDWHVSEGHYAFELVMRNDEQVDKFLAREDSGSVTRLRTVLPSPVPSNVRPGASSSPQSVSTPGVVTEDEAWAAIDMFESTRIVVGK